MKIPTNTRFLIQSSIALTLAMAIWFSFQAWSEEPAETAPAMQTAMMELCAQMMEKKQKMMEDRKAQDTALIEQLAEMNSAPEDQKVKLMAALITTMVTQRVAMQEQMEKVREEMMAHMILHTQMGQETMSQCPMMKGMGRMGGMSGMSGMKPMGEKPADDHQVQQPESR